MSSMITRNFCNPRDIISSGQEIMSQGLYRYYRNCEYSYRTIITMTCCTLSMMIDDEDAINFFLCMNKSKLIEDFEITPVS